MKQQCKKIGITGTGAKNLVPQEIMCQIMETKSVKNPFFTELGEKDKVDGANGEAGWKVNRLFNHY